jgi:hypothetical protein
MLLLFVWSFLPKAFVCAIPLLSESFTLPFEVVRDDDANTWATSNKSGRTLIFGDFSLIAHKHILSC